MAETEIFEVIEEAEEGVGEAEEGLEDMSAEEKAEFESEVSEARENVAELSEDASKFKEFILSSLKSLKSFGKFVVKNVAIGAIFYGVNVTLSKLIHTGGDNRTKDANKKKQEVIKALTQLIKSETEMCKAVKVWLEKHKDETITLDGISIKIEAIFESTLKPISDAIDKSYNASKSLMVKIDGKVSWNVPTADDVGHLLNASASFVDAFGELQKFALEHADRISALKSLLEILSQTALDGIRHQLDVVKKMPFY